MIQKLQIFAAIIVISFLSGCGYQLGLVGQDTSIQNIYCYTVVNQTRKPGLEMPMTNTIIAAFQQYSGGIKIVNSKEEADSFLLVRLTGFDRAPARFNDADVLEESHVTLYADVFVYNYDVDPRMSDIKGSTVIHPVYETSVSASATYFLDPNQPEGEQAIFPQLYDKMSREIVTSIIERW